jgi:quinol monooxygenase YgiN
VSETVIVVGTFEVDPARRDEFLASRLEAMTWARAEPGCVTYVLSADPIEPDLVHLLERWENKACLDDHLERLRQDPPKMTVSARRTELTLYETTAAAPLIV